MVKHRLRRMLWLYCGYPHKLVLMLGTAEEKARAMAEFKLDFEICAALGALPGPSKAMSAYIERSPFQHVAVQQVLAACEEFGFESHFDIEHLLRQRTLTVTQSQGVEDMNNHQKNSRQGTNWGGRYRRPQTGLAV